MWFSAVWGMRLLASCYHIYWNSWRSVRNLSQGQYSLSTAYYTQIQFEMILFSHLFSLQLENQKIIENVVNELSFWKISFYLYENF